MTEAAPRQRRPWRPVHGVLLLDKPTGISSNTALQTARRLFLAAKAGHTGTLDPLASGLLPLCFGEATKFSADLLNADKTYLARLRFGITTSTGDAEGEIRRQRPVNVSAGDLDAAISQFTGDIWQTPPMYSALKRDGKPLYQLARAGIEVERQARQVRIIELAVQEFAGDTALVHVKCSKGGYIRTLAEDIGEALGCGAHLSALRRTGVGEISLNDAHTLDEITATPEDQRPALLLPPDALITSLPRLTLPPDAARRFRNGNPVAVEPPQGKNQEAPPPGRCRVYADNKLLGTGEIDAAGMVHPKRLIAGQ